MQLSLRAAGVRIGTSGKPRDTWCKADSFTRAPSTCAHTARAAGVEWVRCTTSAGCCDATCSWVPRVWCPHAPVLSLCNRCHTGLSHTTPSQGRTRASVRRSTVSTGPPAHPYGGVDGGAGEAPRQRLGHAHTPRGVHDLRGMGWARRGGHGGRCYELLCQIPARPTRRMVCMT